MNVQSMLQARTRLLHADISWLVGLLTSHFEMLQYIAWREQGGNGAKVPYVIKNSGSLPALGITTLCEGAMCRY